MFYLRLGPWALTAACSVSIFSIILPGQSALERRDPPTTVQASGSRFSAQPCQSADFELHLRSSVPAGNSRLPICEDPEVNIPNSVPCLPGSVRVAHCGYATDSSSQVVQGSLGKKGQSIAAARAKVLEILDSDNACTTWFRELEPDPAHTFRTLSFTVDAKGIDYVIERIDGSASRTFVNPYVATVLQGGGESQAVTLNAGGAFFRPSATLVRLAKEGGPVQFQGARTLKVGPYMGDTLQAQVTTLLHELGHVLGLLPLDTNDANGRSAANTREVVRHCQSQIESQVKQRFSASR